MTTEIFAIKSLFVQNAIMLSFLGIVVCLLIRSLFKKRLKHIIVFSIWLLLVIWFFNSPFFGFSTVTVSPKGIKLNYGILSFGNDVLPINSQWKVETVMSGIRRNKRLYFITIGGRQSMNVKGRKELHLLQTIGEAINLNR